MSNADDMYRAHGQAKDYIAKIGKAEPHLGSFGNLCGLTVKTTINFQCSPSSKNYWDDNKFDTALAKAIRNKFNELAADALNFMKNEADAALIAEEKELTERLEKINNLKAHQQAVEPT